MATKTELAIMAGRAYQSTRASINKFPVPDGWQELLDKRKVLPSGFEAGYFQHDKEIVISFAGTNPEMFEPDWIANFNLTTSFACAQQLQEAAAYYLEIKKVNPEAQITFTGE
jgi:hypothetical protein